MFIYAATVQLLCGKGFHWPWSNNILVTSLNMLQPHEVDASVCSKYMIIVDRITSGVLL